VSKVAFIHEDGIRTWSLDRHDAVASGCAAATVTLVAPDDANLARTVAFALQKPTAHRATARWVTTVRPIVSAVERHRLQEEFGQKVTGFGRPEVVVSPSGRISSCALMDTPFSLPHLHTLSDPRSTLLLVLTGQASVSEACTTLQDSDPSEISVLRRCAENPSFDSVWQFFTEEPSIAAAQAFLSTLQARRLVRRLDGQRIQKLSSFQDVPLFLSS